MRFSSFKNFCLSEINFFIDSTATQRPLQAQSVAYLYFCFTSFQRFGAVESLIFIFEM